MATENDKLKLQSLEDIYKALREFFISNFPTPAQLLAWIDNDLNEGKYSLHKWQASLHTNHFSIERTKQSTASNPLELCIRAVNGSGKDEKVITPFVLHFLATNQESSVVLTSASGQQLKTQTEKYLRRYCTILNAKLSALFNLEETYEFFIIQQRYFKCVFTNAECILFATDEEGKAEGYHPTISGAKFAIIVNEGKSIAEPIWEALSRCNGFTHWIEVSSPGKPDGHFFRTCTSTRTTSSGGEAVIKIVVTSDECPHLGGEDYIKRLVEIYGSRDHYMVKSMVDAEFSSADEQVVITYDIYNRLLAYQVNTEHIADTKNCGGLDLAFGGDEIRLQVRNGNKHLGGESLISKDTTIICDTIQRWCHKWNLVGSVVYTDAGGLGAPIVSLLRGQYNLKCIVPINNQWSAQNAIAYKNLGVEMWFNLQKLVAEQEIILKDDDILRKQLCNRYYKITQDNSAILESKAQAKAKGRTSPDRADALVLCFHKYRTPAVKKKLEAVAKKLSALANSKMMEVPLIRNFIKNTTTNNRLGQYMQQNGIINARRQSIVAERGAIKLELQQALRNIYGNN